MQVYFCVKLDNQPYSLFEH